MRAFRFAEQSGYNPQKCRRLGINGAAAREAGQTFEQFLRIAKDEGLDPARGEANDEASSAASWPGSPTRWRCGSMPARCAATSCMARRGVLARESVVHHSPLLVASDVREIQGKEGELTVLLNTATAIEEPWLRELLPEAFRTEEKVAFDPVQRRVIARRHGHVSRSAAALRDDRQGAEGTGRAGAGRGGHRRGLRPAALGITAVEQWIVRLNRLREWMPELELPGIGEAERRMLIEQICHGAATYKEIKERAGLAGGEIVAIAGAAGAAG